MSLNSLHDIGRSKNSDKPLSTSGSFRRAQTSMRFGATSVIAFLLAAAFGAVAQVSARPAKTSVILITIDTVRADRLGCYGAKDVATPTLDGLARDGVVFERAISQVLALLAPYLHGEHRALVERLGARYVDGASSAATQAKE